ncbi:hypothetical protein LDJ79_02895 [Vibrio tritonius]|uniref:beta-N-acetylhexosaminidase n=1 Tax=Vibrio tritonius TaxID=1435069 RepID=A0ABS7YH86_9VIBR|nr:glycoside hydrolase family 3 N-terminal domain-containing protein [Vibrio tritonius]MCA2015041.1 hypothetical protein [Vibrio tritonius]
MVDLRSSPFYLSDNDIAWVTDKLACMSLDEKIGQLFMPVGLSSDEDELRNTIESFKPAGMMFRPGLGKEVQSTHRFLQSCSDIPLLIASNLESGGTGSAIDGTEFGCQMQTAATDDVEMVRGLARISAIEGKALGVNWTFGPVVDLDINPNNPITNVRTFGSDKNKVKYYSSEYIKEVRKQGMATAAKHFPGDGIDDRDQHIVPTYNSLTKEEWDTSYGEIYQEVIAADSLSIMVGHISLPSYSQYLKPTLDFEDVLPASLSPEILQGLLRGKLGFNGLIVTDASAMVGFTSVMPRKYSVPAAIAAGCDIFLFNKDLAEDFQYMKQGIAEGRLSMERVDEAITRTLAMKAALKLHQIDKDELVPQEQALELIGNQAHKNLANMCAEKSITLVKDRDDFLPIDPNKQPNVLLFTLTDDGDFFGNKTNVFAPAIELLESKGFIVDLFDPSNFKMRDVKLSVEDMRKKYDFALYFSNIKPASNKTSLRLNWTRPMGIDAPWFCAELPTVFVSFGNPYHLYDVPRVQTYINAYTANVETIRATINCLLGNNSFSGKSPVDPFMGRIDMQV